MTTSWPSSLVGIYPDWDANNEPQQTCVVKQSYFFNAQGELSPCPAVQIVVGDRYLGKPCESRLLAIDETVAFKQGADLNPYG